MERDTSIIFIEEMPAKRVEDTIGSLLLAKTGIEPGTDLRERTIEEGPVSESIARGPHNPKPKCIRYSRASTYR